MSLKEDQMVLKINTIPFDVCNDTAWFDFIVPVMNIATWDLPHGMRLGQRLVNALSMRDPEIAGCICNTEFDVWQNDDPTSPQFRAFFERIFELFVERRL